MVTRRVSEGLCWQSSQSPVPRLRFGFSVLSLAYASGSPVLSLAYASGSLSCPSLTLRVSCFVPRLRFGFSVLSLAYASGFLFCPRLRFGFPVLSVNDINGCRFEVVVGVYPSDASAFCPPIVSAWGECIQASCCVCFQINAYLFRRCVTGRYQYMNMIRSAVDCVQNPASMLACFFDLGFNSAPLVVRETNCIFTHSRFAIGLKIGTGELPAMLVFYPAASIARQPSAVRHPRQKECDWRIRCSWNGNPTRERGTVLCLVPRLRFGFSVLSLAYASGSLSCPSLTLRVTLSCPSLTLRVPCLVPRLRFGFRCV